MSESLSSVTAARSEKARLYVGNPEPSAEELRRVDTNLATAKIDNRIREYVHEAGHPLDHAQTGHLVGLLLMQAGVPGATVSLIENLTRDAVASAQGGAQS
jgi:hypothetical protein